jgi:hypothetical protein
LAQRQYSCFDHPRIDVFDLNHRVPVAVRAAVRFDDDRWPIGTQLECRCEKSPTVAMPPLDDAEADRLGRVAKAALGIQPIEHRHGLGGWLRVIVLQAKSQLAQQIEGRPVWTETGHRRAGVRRRMIGEHLHELVILADTVCQRRAIVSRGRVTPHAIELRAANMRSIFLDFSTDRLRRYDDVVFPGQPDLARHRHIHALSVFARRDINH